MLPEHSISSTNAFQGTMVVAKSFPCLNYTHELRMPRRTLPTVFCRSFLVSYPPHSTALLQHHQSKRRNNAQPDNRPSSLLNLPIRNHAPHIPHQMPQTIKPMEGKRKRKRRLSKDLERHRPSRKRSRHRRRLEVPSEERRGQVRRAEDVEGARQNGACDAVEG